MLIVWNLAAVGVVLAGVQQIMTYRADREHERQQQESEQRHKEEQSELKARLESSMQRQEYMRGQLDSIGLMIARLGEGRSDTSLTKLADAIGKMARMPLSGGQAPSEPRCLSEARRSQLAVLLRSGSGAPRSDLCSESR